MAIRNNDGQYENRQSAVEMRDAPEHAHLAAGQHAQQDHLTAAELSRRASEHLADAPPGTFLPTTGHGVTAFGHEDIARRAHELWIARGCPAGSPDQDWFEAVKELRERAIAGEPIH